MGIASWKLLDWFQEVNGIKNVSKYDAEDVTIHVGGNEPLQFDTIRGGEEVQFKATDNYVSVSWRDGAGMHADIVRIEA